MQINPVVLAFNRGRISRFGAARVDLKRHALSAEVQTNWMPSVMGSMMLRAGMGYLGSTRSNALAKFLPFIFATSDFAMIELTDLVMRVWVDDAVITRGAVSSAVTNGNFDTDVASWTDSDEAGGTSVWVTGGYLGLTGNGTNAAIRDQQITVAAGDQNDEHALRIVIQRGPVTLRVGSTAGGDEYIAETELATGTHSLAFTPTGNFHIRLLSRLKRQVLVSSVNVEASGAMEITAPWAAADLSLVRHDQSGDIVFVDCRGYRQRQIERRSTRSWSIVEHLANDGPFRVENVGPVTITPSAINGNITMTASAPLFRSTQVGALFRITSNGQTVTQSITAENTFTNAIRVIGVGDGRIFGIVVDEDAAGAATFTLQRSFESDSGPWTDSTQWTADVSTTRDDSLDNQIVWYRIGVKTGDYVSGTHSVSLTYSAGSIDGIVRLTEFTSSTSVAAEVLADLGGTGATDNWAEGAWSDYRGFPSVPKLYEGRLWHFGKNGAWGSVSDAFTSHDLNFEGDAGPISRTLGPGPVDQINWAVALQRLIVGAEGAEISVRSSSFDEPLTAGNFNPKNASTQGSTAVAAVTVDDTGIYVDKAGTRLYELRWETEKGDYGSGDLTKLIPEIGEPGIVHIAVQRKPDTRIHCVRSDGTVGLLVHDRTENVLCWIDVETDGDIEDILILPGSVEDRVYYVVKRTVNSATVRYVEKWALESECRRDNENDEPLDLCKLADSFVVYEGAATATLSCAHLEGEEVIVWADGVDRSPGWGEDQTTYTVTGGAITLPAPTVTKAVVGLPYSSRWKGTKLAMGVPEALNKRSKIEQFGLVLVDTHRFGLRFGSDFDDENAMDDLPGEEQGAEVDEDYVWESYALDLMSFPGGWSPDSRLCLMGQAPRPVTVCAAIMEASIHVKGAQK